MGDRADTTKGGTTGPRHRHHRDHLASFYHEAVQRKDSAVGHILRKNPSQCFSLSLLTIQEVMNAVGDVVPARLMDGAMAALLAERVG